MSLWAALVSENPMLIEVRRYRRRFFGGGRPSGLNVAALTLGAICYAGLLMLVGNANGSIPGIAIVMIQTGVFALAAPAMLNAAIAGEREKRTWDLLLAAPVSKAQILIGKFAGAMSNLLIGAVLFSLPVFICAVSYERTDFGYLMLAEANSIAFGVLVCAMSLLFSARCRRGFTAMAVCLGALLVWLIVYPALITSVSFGGPSDGFTDFLFVLHPFYGQAKMIFTPYAGSDSLPGMSPGTLGILQTLMFLGLAVVLLVWTERTLTFSDNETKFIPRKKHA